VGGGREEKKTFHTRGGTEQSGIGGKNVFTGKEEGKQKLMTRKAAERGGRKWFRIEFYRELSVILSLLFI
jgi:hypothetical protein